MLAARAQVNGQCEEASNLLNDMPATNFVLYVVTGNLVLDACATVIGQWE